MSNIKFKMRNKLKTTAVDRNFIGDSNNSGLGLNSVLERLECDDVSESYKSGSRGSGSPRSNVLDRTHGDAVTRRTHVVLMTSLWAALLLVSCCRGALAAQQQQRHRHNNRQVNQLSSAVSVQWPNVFNVAAYAFITANATCGMHGREEFCRWSGGPGRHRGGHSGGGGSHGGAGCGVCDASSPDLARQHPIENAIDGSNRWWQSPSLDNGPEYEYVTITLDLRQVYQIAYVIVKAANSPRPGSWILERSVDGETFLPWQYYAVSDQECWDRYGISPIHGEAKFTSDTEVICTSEYSQLKPLENGEIHTSLIHGRPGANESTPELFDFTIARYVRLRLQRLRAAVLLQEAASLTRWKSPSYFTDFSSSRRVGSIPDKLKLKSLYYSIRHITIGGQCVCNGHASKCAVNTETGLPQCECEHNTCGLNCDKCCPLYNQAPYKHGSLPSGGAPAALEYYIEDDEAADAVCELCQCHGHAVECLYDDNVAKGMLSIDTKGRYRGGGVCINCTAHTTGINCNQCLPGYYRPPGVALNSPEPCVPCDCHPVGSIGDCLREALLDDQTVGDCLCKPGFTGPRCSECATGYRGFPDCDVCPCDLRGTILDDGCDKECRCKNYVEGEKCNYCKPGYFALQVQNPNGCSDCYCSGVSSSCKSIKPLPQLFQTQEDWLITDLSASFNIKPYHDNDTNWLIIGSYELPSIEAYYWLAPPIYCSNKLEAYGSTLSFTLNWEIMRGDTSGKPTKGPNLILIGANGLRIAYGDEIFYNKNATISIVLREDSWYHVPEDVKDIVTRLRRTEYRGDSVTRYQFMSVLSNVKHLLLRAKFHTDQSECALERASLEIKHDEEDIDESLVEKCDCPVGYKGLSCEMCDYGYVRVEVNTSTHLRQGKCVKCNCNGHSATCNFETGDCQCEHNTIGENCERCASGYYGNALIGTPDDCRKCACPLLEPDNNFSPSCQLDVLDLDVATSDDEDYVCTQCPNGYAGDHCEMCDNGYFGDPLIPGSKCEPCVCNGGPCDRLSGQCLSCRGNTEGWRCEKCKKEHYGDPLSANCQACHCDELGSVSQECDEETGQCDCLEKYTGRTCSECEAGFGNVTAGCPPCTCDEIGAVSSVCHPVTGLCECRFGVEGFRCDACQHLHYGLTEEGCQSCNCNIDGSEILTCDIKTGQCRCKPHVSGKTCDTCEIGYWGIKSRNGCSPCECDIVGSVDNTCDPHTGQCRCKPGIGGLRCDNCLPNFYGFSDKGCKKCDFCDKPGHICDPDTGRCVCPPFSQGESCQRCVQNSWGIEPYKGCKVCRCDQFGATRSQCDIFTGICECRQGYVGHKCNQCAIGFYGYPRCRRCNCDIAGTVPEKCDPDTGLCPCDEQGHCTCKTNVIGPKCDECRNGTFGLEQSNPAGCTQCFCFGRTSHCTQAGLTWGQIRLKSSRSLKIWKQDDYWGYNQHTPHIAYIRHTIPKRNMYPQGHNPPSELIELPHRKLNKTNGLHLIPEHMGNITLGLYHFYKTPLYWQLPSDFVGDRIVSYGGFLQFSLETVNITELYSHKILNRYPLVLLRGNGIAIAHFPLLPPIKGKYEVRLHESLWTVYHEQDHALLIKDKKVTRDLLMVILQNVQAILIRSSEAEQFSKAVLYDATLDTAIEVTGQPPPIARGVELCECPKKYNSSSCQNPSIGFYRWHNTITANSTIVIDLIGEAKPCECNGRSDICDTETGYCLNCTENTAGATCEICAEGHYGDPQTTGCRACPCPTTTRTFARSCYQQYDDIFVCECREGYTGKYCDRCSLGYYGYPDRDGGSCRPCLCNVYGTENHECDERTGQCTCKPGISGRDCSICNQPRHILEHNQCVPCDNCTQTLLNDIEAMMYNLTISTDHIKNGIIPPPWENLYHVEREASGLDKSFSDWNRLTNKIESMPMKPYEQLKRDSKKLEHRLERIKKRGERANNEAAQIRTSADEILDQIVDMRQEMEKTVDVLEKYTGVYISVADALKEGEKLLNSILERDFSEQIYDADRVLRECSITLDQLLKIKEDLDDFYSRVNDMESIIGQTLRKIDNVINMVDENQINLQNFKNKLDRIDKLEEDLHKLDSDILLEDSRRLYNNSKDTFEKLSMKSIEFHNLKQRVREREQEANDLSQIVWAAQEHSKNLTAISDKIKNLLSKTRTEADIALKASQAYNDIIASIEAARQAASEAILANRNLNETLFPPDDDSLFDRSTNVLADTKRLKHRAENQKNKINNLKEREMYLKKITIQTIKDMIWNSGLQDNNMTLELQKFNIDAIRDKVRNILNTAIQESMDMKNVYNQAKKMLDQKSYKLIPALNELNASEANITITVSSTEELLAEAQGNLSKMNAELHIIDRLAISQKQTFNELNDTFALHLQKLKNIIMEARRLASEIQIPLRSTDDSKCSRIYQPHSAAPSTSTTISFVISATTDVQNSSLFYLFGAENHFIAVEMVNRRIRLIWNLGSDTASIRHPEKIETLTQNSGYYYDVEIERIRNIGKLLVKKKFKFDGSTVRDSSSEPVTGKTNSNATLLKLGDSPQIVIGSVVGDGFKNANILADQGLKVSIYDVFLDEKPVGLWNYRYTNKGACESDKYWSYTANTYQFNGNGYAVRTRSSSNPKTTMSIMLTFKTFDENALLLVIISMDKKSYLSISLKEGRVVYFVQYVGESILKIETNEKYNIGKEINIEGSRIFDRKTGEQAILIVDKKEKLGKPDIPLHKKDQLPDFKNATYYFGGVPPNFFTKMKDSIVHELSPSNSLLGCMSNILINTERHDPMDSEHDGVEYSCSDKNLNKVGFFGKGYIKLGLSDLQKVLSLSFVFHTRQDNALIMFMKIRSDSKKEFGHYQITLLNGKIYVEIKLGKNIISLTSQKTYSDGIYHAVTIIIENKNTELRIDDYFEDSKTQKIIGLPDEVYFGGYPDKDNVEMIVDNKSPFTGTIKDVIINDKIILFDSPLEFEDVKIGRHGPDMPASLLIIPTHIPIGKNTSVDRCSKITSYAPEDGALKFGDAPHSYSHYQFPFTKFWQKNFTLQFEFRTFYPNGMLFVTPGFREKQRHFIVLQLKNKDISFTVRGKPKLQIKTTMNDGNWHQIKVRNQNRKLTLTVDGKSWNAGKAPKKLNIANMMYIGGLPKYGHRLPENVVKELEPFKGCVRNFIVNDFPRDLTTTMDNVRQCFPKIERGSYFSGDGYAVYNKHFQIDVTLELSLEFRTSEMNGILMTMSESVGQPAFSLELHNGRVIISGEVGLDKPIRLEAGPSAVYGLCDNKWHNVTAFYSKEEITIVVDSYLNRWVQRNTPAYNEGNIDSPLFIGGLPDSVSGGTLQTRDNFKGCIRNVVIGNEQKDWTDMEELHNILLSSCPVA